MPADPVEVDENDPAFQNPTKPVGSFYSERDAKDIQKKLGWTMKEDAGRGWRYVVPSPKPKHIVDVSLIETIANSGAVVIAGGGGGIPVIRNADGTRRGIEAVIDKDLSSAHMANILDVDTLMILTAVDKVYINFGQPTQQALGDISHNELLALYERGEFADGSMAPKVEACINFLNGGGRRAVIAHLDDAQAALQGRAGTQVTRQ